MRCIIFIAAVLASFALFGGVEARRLTIIGGDAAGINSFKKNVKSYAPLFKRYPKDANFKGEYVVLSNSVVSYGFWMQGQMVGDDWFMALGMPTPSKANWYGNGFYNLQIAGVKSAACPAVIEKMGNENGEAFFVVKWRFPGSVAQLRISLRAGLDCLFLETNVVASDASPKEYRISLRAYPNDFGKGWKPGLKTRKREIMTSNRTIKAFPDHPVKINLSGEEPWIFLYDTYFNRANNRGEGPCAAIFNHAETASNTVNVSNYACILNFNYPITTVSHLILWDFHNQTNAAAKQIMKRLTITFKQ